MKSPAFQFYAADWLANVKLRRCTPTARGAWIDVLCLMHGSDEYGVLRWPLAEIAGVINVPVKVLRELAERGVLKGAESGAADYIFTPRHAGKDGDPVVLVTTKSGPCWYSSRFVRDEWIRQRRGANTRFDTDNQPPKPPPKPPIGERQGDPPKGEQTPRQGDGASSSVYNPSSKGKNMVLGARLTEPPAAAQPIEGQQLIAGMKPPATRKNLNGSHVAEPSKSGFAWNAYAAAYRLRYGTDPVRNSKANKILCLLVDRLGADEAPQVAAWYVRHQGAWYVRNGHSLDQLLKDAEKLRTEWATGNSVTDSQARQADRTQGTANIFGRLIAEAEAKERGVNEH